MQRRITGASKLWHAVHVIADEVGHHHIRIALTIAKGPSGHGADVLLELVDGTAVLGPMA